VQVTKPIPNFIAQTSANICQGDAVTFLNTSAGGTTYLWDFGDGNFSSLQNPTNVYADTGYFTVTLLVTDINGCDSTVIKINFVHVQAYPLAAFTSDTLIASCYPLLVLFTDTSLGDYISGWQWDFGDQQAGSSLQNPAHNYVYPGWYDVTLIVTTTYGCSDTIVKPQYIQVNGPYAELNLFPDTICKGDSVTFNMVGDTNVYYFEWDFGDGNTGSGNPVTHVYYKVGVIYPVLLYSDSNLVCNKFALDSIYVYEVIADFTRSDTADCAPFTVVFSDSSNFATNWFWDFGDGGNSTTESPNYTFTIPGTYTVSLIVTNDIGCSDTITKSIVVHPLPSVQTRNDSIICWGDSIQLFSQGSGGVASYQWSPATWLTDDKIQSPMAFPENTTTYTVVVTDTNGCTSSSSLEVVVHQMPQVVTQRDTAIIIGETIYINTYTQPGVTYLWTPAYGLSCTDCPNPVANPLVTTTYTLTITDSLNCFQITINVLVEVLEEYTIDVPTAFTPNGDGTNDIIYVKGWGIKDLVEFKIYNRWGQLVFETDDLSVGWDGHFKGKLQNVETYVYVVNAIMYDNEVFSKKGYISLLR